MRIRGPKCELKAFTPTESQVDRLSRLGRTPAEIAEDLGKSVKQVRRCLKSCAEKRASIGLLYRRILSGERLQSIIAQLQHCDEEKELAAAA